MSATSLRRRVWRVPAVLALLTVLGLLSALLGEPLAWRVLAWMALAVPVGVACWFARPR